MNYRRHFHLKARVRDMTIATGFSALALLFFLSMAMLSGRGTRQNIAMTFACLALIAAVSCLHMIIRDVRELDRLDREDDQENPWRSQPRISREDPAS